MSTTPNAQPTVEQTAEQLQALQTSLAEVKQEPVAPEAPKQKFVVETATGQKFIGQTQADVIAEMQKSIENATQELARLHKMEKAIPATPAPVLSPEQEAEVSTRKWIADQNAQALGYQNADEMKADLSEWKVDKELRQGQRVIAEFHDKNQDFPANEAAAKAIEDTMKNYGLPFTPQGLTAAHVICLRDKKYEPVVASASSSPATPNPSVPQGINAPTNASDEIDPTLPTAEYRRLLEEKFRQQGGVR